MMGTVIPLRPDAQAAWKKHQIPYGRFLESPGMETVGPAIKSHHAFAAEFLLEAHEARRAHVQFLRHVADVLEAAL